MTNVPYIRALARDRAEAAARLEYLTGMTIHSDDGLENYTYRTELAAARRAYARTEEALANATACLTNRELDAIFRKERVA